ncbi:MAG: metal ABC transporter solute-binding protein, Zn/Mn family [Actinomycetes bacterium]
MNRARPIRRAVLLAASLAVLALGASACSAASTGGGSTTPGGTAAIPVVAAENFYGDLLSQLGGPYVSVTSVITSPDADPHLFEPGTATGLAISRARLVVMNGVGYDAFMTKLIDATPSPGRVVVDVGQALGVTGTEANPHLWYDVPRLPTIAAALTAGLTKADPAHAAYFAAAKERFVTSLAPLDAAVAAIKARYAGTPVAYTEPVPGYLIEAAGLTNATPPAFALAIENGNEPSPQATAAMEGLLTGKKVKVLMYNTQTVDQITERLRTLAAANGIPVVGVSETMPAHTTFQAWQTGQVVALQEALAR